MSIGKLLTSLVTFILLLIICALLGLTYWTSQDRQIPYNTHPGTTPIPTFVEKTIDFVPSYDATKTLPFIAGAIIDINNDGVEEIFIGGGINQQDALYEFRSGSFIDITQTVGWTKQLPDTTFSAVSLDFDRDNDNDLLISRQSGIYLYDNQDGRFEAQRLTIDLDSESVPLSVAISDLNRDGFFDMYVSGYIAREFVEGETIFNKEYGGVSALYINRGDNSFDNITEAAGLLHQHNTFQSMFIDVDGDQLEDLVVAHDTGQIRTWKNQGNLRFTNQPNPSTNLFSYPMGIAVSDLGNDQLPDFFFSNVGSTVPVSLLRGDLRDDQSLLTDWILFKNLGGFNFSDTAEEAQLADFEFAWGAVFEDLNLDGKDDLVVSQNYEGWPLHKIPFWRLNGRLFLQTEDEKFVESSKPAKVINQEYGISPLAADFNQDGYPDIVHINLLGPQKVFLSNPADAGYLKVKLPNTVDSIGTLVSVTRSDGLTINQFFVVGEGLVSDQSHILTFGLGDHSATSVSIQRLDGVEEQLEGNYRNQLLAPKIDSGN